MKGHNSNKPGPVWRESASLIICSRNTKTTDGFDYELLMIKRSSQTASVQNQVVFPGGVYDKSDEDVEWLKYFQEFGITQQSLKQLVVIDYNIERPKILFPQGTGCYDRFFKGSMIWAREISLRINAIRETFEEVGVLMCRSRDQLDSHGTEGYFMRNCNVTNWQQAVHDDSANFLKMCKALKVVPDLWSLYEWSCWASPGVFKKGYETVFFITFLNEKPTVTCDASEVAEHLWVSPFAVLRMVRQMEIFLLPPQFYEVSRFVLSKSYEDLKRFAHDRTSKGITMYDAILYLCTDGVVSVLPGDDYYTGCPRLATEYKKLDFSIGDFRLRSKRLHRVENGGMFNAAIYLNFEPLDGQLRPLCGRAAINKL